MAEGCADFHDDWEILGHGSDSPRSSSVETLDGNDEVAGDGAGGIIKVDYFTVQGSGGSDNARSGNDSATELGVDDSESDEERRFGDFVGNKAEDEIVLGAGDEVKGEISLYESVQNDIRKFGDEVMVQTNLDEMENKGATEEEESRSAVVWWKVPFELVRYCVLRMGHPVWSLSVAAAIMGAVILGRKLYKMKQKSRGLQLKVSVDDKKVSQIMSHAARLNEAFSLVRRVPITRPVIPAPGVSSPWPAMSMR